MGVNKKGMKGPGMNSSSTNGLGYELPSVQMVHGMNNLLCIKGTSGSRYYE